ncbi:MAG: isoleucine--tRNA ligase [Myxococcales bacterium]
MTTPVFAKVSPELDFPSEERQVLAFWKDQRIFERSLADRRHGPPFVFYEGPPTANGLPHNGHVLTRVLKDLFPRYKTMRGFFVPRKAGWDTHGLPVEVEVEKELRIHGKAAIEAYGVEPFVQKCIESVFRYTTEWESLTERVAFWCDLQEAYVTYHQSYVESVWWALSELFKKGLLYQGHKVVWWWAQGGTALSSAEVGLGYKPVDDPSVFVAFPLVDSSVSLLVWTTTPWTLPSNMYAAVHPNFDYATVEVTEGHLSGRLFLVALDLVDSLAKKLGPLKVLRTQKGTDLEGLAYVPPFDLPAPSNPRVKTKDGRELPAYWRVITADFVSKDAAGIVHIAPAFGEDDHQAHRRELARLVDPSAVDMLCAVRPDGTFGDDFPRYTGRWVKDCDKEIQHELKERGLLIHAETTRHDYPFCWRADSDPLIQYARPAWYIRTTSLIQDAITNNRTIQWLPEHIKEGRFGDFLANNVDWALSRERYWGTPLNIWINDITGNKDAPASVAEILAKNPRAFDHFRAAKEANPSLSDHLMVHKPWIDQVTWETPGEPGVYRRVPEVIDCWFDSGCMPFAQWGFPHKGVAEFQQSFPADFISEAIDQTRGWFYSLLMISTLVFDSECQKRLGLKATPFPHPFKTCIVLGHVSDKEGKKESKSKGNYTPPEVILDHVRMEFAVVEGAEGPETQPGTALIAREDLEGLDLTEGARVRVYRAGQAVNLELVLHAGKKLPRRVVVLHPSDRTALGVRPTTTTKVKPVEVPWLASEERVVIEDPSSPAPGADAFRWFFYASSGREPSRARSLDPQ